jgi:hypothetical protein
MSSSRTVSEDAKDEFWAIVEGCLREFHGMKQETIRRKAAKLRSAIEGMKPAEVEYFYHSEPFDVACELGGKPLNVASYLDRYLHIRDEKHGNGISKQKGDSRRKANFQK